MSRSLPAILWFGLALALFAPAHAASSVDLAGTWYVLVHYRDAESGKPDQLRWEDRVWRFEPEGDRLRWTDYPIVVFGDESGRFERLGSNRQSRILGGWEPNASQQARIAAGLEVNPRGSKSKTLDATADGWSTTARPLAPSSSFLTYSETWLIEDLSTPHPVFSRLDSLGGARAETLEGATRYSTRKIEAGGNVLRGDFVRDGTREGTFRLFRSGVATDVQGSGRTQGERVRELFFGEAAPLLGGDGASPAPTPNEAAKPMPGEAGKQP